MTRNEAVELLGFHCGRDPRTDDPRWTYGFLGSLRPFSGLRARNFHEVMACIYVLSNDLQRPTVPRDIFDSLWAICFHGYSWGISPGGMLRRNGLISESEIERLEEWLETISYAISLLLDAVDHFTPSPKEFAYEPPPEWEAIWRAMPA